MFLEITGEVLIKIADDTRGPVIDPSTMEREISQEKLPAAREYLRFRFPSMVNAPLVETRVCQYENSRDHNFILHRHPEAENVWIVGGGLRPWFQTWASNPLGRKTRFPLNERRTSVVS